jgi:hypothetical protein
MAPGSHVWLSVGIKVTTNKKIQIWNVYRQWTDAKSWQ